MQLHVVHDVNLLAPATKNSLYISNRKRGSGRRNRIVFFRESGVAVAGIYKRAAHTNRFFFCLFLIGYGKHLQVYS